MMKQDGPKKKQILSAAIEPAEETLDMLVRRSEYMQALPDEVVPIERRMKAKPSVTSLPFLQEQAPAPAGNKNRYKLVFKIERGYQDFSGMLRNPYHCILPALRYMRRDGTEGRLEKFNPKKLTETIGEAESFLYSSLGGEAGNKGFLRDYLAFLGEHPDMQIVVDDVKGQFPVTCLISDTMHLSFQLKSLSHDKKDAIFKPIIVFHNATESARMECGDPNALHIFGFSFYCMGEKGALAWRMNDKHWSVVLTMVKKSGGSLDIGDIDDVIEYVGRNKVQGIRVDFKKRALRLIHSVPVPLLDIKPQYFGIEIRLLFNYRGKEIPFSNTAEPLVLGQETQDAESEVIVEVRDKEYEKGVYAYINFLLADHIQPENYHNWHYSSSDPDFRIGIDINAFILKYAAELMKARIVMRVLGSQTKITPRRGKVAYRIKSGIDWFEVRANYVDEDGTEEELVVDTDHLNSGLLRVGETITVIGEKDIERLKKLAAEGMNGTGALRFSKYDYTMIDELYDDLVNREGALENAKRIGDRLRNFTRIGPYAVPAGFQGLLRDYQKAGYDWLNFLNEYGVNGCLADDMGLGKTVQALALLQNLKERNELRVSLVVVPVTTMGNWEREIDRFTPGIRYLRHSGQGRSRTMKELAGFDLIITSYHTLRNDIDLFREIDFQYVVLDESQHIKNSESQVFKAVKLLQGTHRLTLTGTPIENNTLELWAQMDFLNPGLLGSRREFQSVYARAIEKYADMAAAERLRKRVFPFLLRRKKENVAKELPEKEEIVVYSEMDSKQAGLYESCRNECRETVGKTIEEKGLPRSSIEIFTALLRLRQIALFPSLVAEGFKEQDSCKFNTFVDMIDEIIQEGHKVLVFSQFVKPLRIIEKHIGAREYPYSYLDGSSKDRDENIKRFQEDEAVRVFLLSLKAGGVGINLTAADYVILFDPWWNPAVEQQAIDRSHRIGQVRKVIAYRLIVRGTVEEKILELQKRKKKLVADLIAEEASFFKGLVKDDVMRLFEK